MTVIHLISQGYKLKTLTHETLLFNKLALFSGGKRHIFHNTQSIKVNDPLFTNLSQHSVAVLTGNLSAGQVEIYPETSFHLRSLMGGGGGGGGGRGGVKSFLWP